MTSYLLIKNWFVFIHQIKLKKMRAKREFNSEDEWLDYYRHYAAAMALQGFAKNFNPVTEMEDLAVFSVKAADALITALNQKP